MLCHCSSQLVKKENLTKCSTYLLLSFSLGSFILIFSSPSCNFILIFLRKKKIGTIYFLLLPICIYSHSFPGNPYLNLRKCRYCIIFPQHFYAFPDWGKTPGYVPLCSTELRISIVFYERLDTMSKWPKTLNLK